MYNRKGGLLSFGVIVGLGALSACGTTTTGGPSGSSGTGSLANCSGNITVATDFPLTGGDSTDGPFPQQGAQLAVEQANTKKTLGGCKLNYVSKDDSSVAKNGHDPNQGKLNITALAGDSSVVGVVGPFNSTVALAEIPLASQNHLALISPSVTNPGFTQVGSNPLIDTNALYGSNPHTFFRVIADDGIQAAILAHVATTELSLTKAYVFDDQEIYGAGISTIFKKLYAADGGTVVGTASLPGSTTTFSTQISDASSKGATLLFFGGTTGNGGGLVRRDMGSGGLNIQFMCGDGCQDKKFITDANSGSNTSEAEGALATSAPDVTQLSSAASFYSDWTTRYASMPAPYNDGKNEPYSAYGYDAMNILIQAIKTALLGNGGQVFSDTTAFRDAVVAALHNTAYDGAIGHTSFNQAGDTLVHTFTLYKVTSGTWVAGKTYTVDASGGVSVKS
jgi:branched-chain amino acid transport system substrate-binding protein